MPSPNGKIALIEARPTTAPQDKATSDLIDTLRNDVVPKAAGGLPVYVGGITAIFDDFAGVLTDKLPQFIAVIVLLGCLLLMIAFRSILIPLTAAVMNLLAAGAAFGVVTLVFQKGFLAGPLGVGTGPVEAFLPVMMLAILFGLSMDYQVFLVSRMHEEWMRTHDNGHSVRIGQAATGRVITAAATIMIFVFGSFLLAGQRVIAEFGDRAGERRVPRRVHPAHRARARGDAHARRPQLVAAARAGPRAAARGGGGRGDLGGIVRRRVSRRAPSPPRLTIIR